MVNRENGEGRSITFWNSRADILANERNRYYQQQLIKFANLFTAPPIREEYEVIIQEE